MKSPFVLSLGAVFGALIVLLAGWGIYTRSFEGVDPAVEDQAVEWQLAKDPVFGTTILPTGGTPLIDSGTVTFTGERAMVTCSVCHTTREPLRENAEGRQLETFHQGLQINHGRLNCLSCHHAENYDLLRKADGSFVAYEKSMQLCAQCHGPQYRDYQHGSHGGMTGFWDLNQGGPSAQQLPRVPRSPCAGLRSVPPGVFPSRPDSQTWWRNLPTQLIAMPEENQSAIKPGISRRTAVKALGATLGAAAFAKAIAPLTEWKPSESVEDYLQKHYRELSPEEMEKVLRRIEEDARESYGRQDIAISDPQAQPGVKFGYALNLSICVGCRRCAEACHKENNHDRPSGNSYIRVLEMDKGSLDLAKGRADYDHPVPQADKFYLPVQCQQCDAPPCVDVCPVEATWKEKDGIVVVDYNWCIGCRYCEAACPYHARRFNWKKPEVPAEEINPVQAYLSNRVRPQGVMEKCTFCLHRTRNGKLPACLEACPTGARVFGNLLDPNSEIRWVLTNKRVFVLKEELGTKPSFFYFFDE